MAYALFSFAEDFAAVNVFSGDIFEVDFNQAADLLFFISFILCYADLTLIINKTNSKFLMELEICLCMAYAGHGKKLLKGAGEAGAFFFGEVHSLNL
jgi:hypothetical protein